MRKTFQIWLFIFIVSAFSLTLFISFYVQTEQTASNAEELIRLRISDAESQLNTALKNVEIIKALVRADAIAKVRALADLLKADPSIETDKQKLASLRKRLDIDEIHITDPSGIISASSENFVGYDMNSQAQSAEFMPALSNPDFELVQAPSQRGIDKEIFQYAGVARQDRPGIVQIGYRPKRLQEAMAVADIRNFSSGFRIGNNGLLLICQDGRIIGSNKPEMMDSSLAKYSLTPEKLDQEVPFKISMDGEQFLGMSRKFRNCHIVGILPFDEMYFSRNTMLKFLIFGNLILFGVVFVLVSFLVEKIVIRDIYKINRALSKITGGNLDVLVNVRSNPEFIVLSDGINATVNSLKRYIAEAAARIDAELDFARKIQLSALPNIFPPYPERHEFDIHANMFAAKEVGGDFYDFQLIDEKHLMVLVADVSGKGIGAALFMMNAKTLLKSLVASGLAPSEVFTRANRELCERNETGMFVTVFMGYLDLESGLFTYVNAGHNAPLLYSAAIGSFSYIRTAPNLVLAAMNGIRYREHEMQMAPGDRLFLYTDGVTEAQNEKNELFGDNRLIEFLNTDAIKSADTGAIIDALKARLDEFANTAPQFDDITALTLKYKGKDAPLSELTISAVVENLDKVTSFISERIEAAGCPPKASMQLLVAVEEIFVNIARYAYVPGKGPASIGCEVTNNDGIQVTIRFIDGGIPYNPLERRDPDINMTADEREIGGLGIFMVKKTMDELDYRYEDGRNILTIKKSCP